jgi:glucokinase
MITHRDDVPDNGWVYNLPFRTGIADDYISRRGLLTLAREMGIPLRDRDVKEFAAAADQGDEASITLFHRFGINMAEALDKTLLSFKPEIVVLGGQIAKSGHLFVPSFSSELLRRGIHAEAAVSENTLKSTLLGIYRMLQDNA